MPGTLLFGGSFDPIHHGHLIAARAVAEHLGISSVVLIPSALPPHRQAKSLAPASDRLAMCRLAVAGDPLFSVDDWELKQAGPSYTLHTVRHFRERLGPAERLCWLIGSDSLAGLAHWYRVVELVQECEIITAIRPGADPDLAELARRLPAERFAQLRANLVPTPLIAISSTEIRARVRTGREIRYLTPDAVARLVSERGLYADSREKA